MYGDVILYGPDSLPYTGKNTNVAASVAVAGVTGAPQGPYPLGQQLVLRDGRKYRYCSVGGTTLVVGNVISSAAVLSTDIDQSAVASVQINPYNGTPTTNGLPSNTNAGNAIGLTHGAATVIANFFAEGFIFVTITPGFADTYKIANHVALSNGANATVPDVINLWPGSFIRRALTDVTSKVSLAQHPYSRVIQCAATISGVPIGVAVVALTGATGRGNFGWLQTSGPCAVLGAGTLTIGSPAVALLSGGTAGAVAPASAATQPEVGKVLNVEATTQATLLQLTIDK